MRRIAGTLLRAALIWILRTYLVTVYRTTRWRMDVHPDTRALLIDAADSSALVAFWHEYLPLVTVLHRWALPQNPAIVLNVLISRNRDGRIIADIVSSWGLGIIEGSSDRRGKNKGGSAAMREILRRIRRGEIVGVTPDGPRGPRRTAQPGTAALARMAGRPVVPMSATCPGIHLGSWDKMRLPLPFGRGRVVCGPPLVLTDVSTEDATAQITEALNRVSDAAESHLSPMPSRLWAGIATVLAPGLRFNLRRRVSRGKEIPARLAERLGNASLPRPAGPLLWLHAASVGETISILPLIDALLAENDATPEAETGSSATTRQAAPAPAILVTTGTVTAARILAERVTDPRVLHQFVPLDVPFWIGRFLRHWQPDLLALTESELWPNLIGLCARRDIPAVLINGRMSARSRNGWRRAPRIARRMLGSLVWIAARSEEDAARFRALGGRDVFCIGDLKTAAPPLPADETELAALKAALGNRPLFLAASTHEGEEEVVLDAARRLREYYPDLLTLIVPRHPERGASLGALAENAPRRALKQLPGSADPVWIVDTLGELGLFYRLCDVVFLGNSLPSLGKGGHNPFEPARLGCAIATGPVTGNFQEAFQALHDVISITPDSAALAEWAAGMLAMPKRRAGIADHARSISTRDQALPARLARRMIALARS